MSDVYCPGFVAVLMKRKALRNHLQAVIFHSYICRPTSEGAINVEVDHRRLKPAARGRQKCYMASFAVLCAFARNRKVPSRKDAKRRQGRGFK
jgi:hypothetical protein